MASNTPQELAAVIHGGDPNSCDMTEMLSFVPRGVGSFAVTHGAGSSTGRSSDETFICYFNSPSGSKNLEPSSIGRVRGVNCDMTEKKSSVTQGASSSVCRSSDETFFRYYNSPSGDNNLGSYFVDDAPEANCEGDWRPGMNPYLFSTSTREDFLHINNINFANFERYGEENFNDFLIGSYHPGTSPSAIADEETSKIETNETQDHTDGAPYLNLEDEALIDDHFDNDGDNFNSKFGDSISTSVTHGVECSAGRIDETFVMDFDDPSE